jgi:hypothetical protein
MRDAVAQLEKDIAEIRQAAQQQADKITFGVTEEKNKSLDILVDQSLKIANIIYIHAFLNKDSVLLSKVNVNKSMFYNTHANDALTLANNIIAIANSHADIIKDLGIDQVEIDNLQNAINNFTPQIQKPQITMEERKVFTTNLKTLFASADSVIYDLLDKYITLFKSSVPDFYLQYKAARNIITLGRRNSKN